MTTFGDKTGLPLDERMRRSIALWRERRGMSARRFGVGALGVPGFVGLQARGLDTREAAAWLGLSPRTVARYRLSGEGPEFRRVGTRVRCPLKDLEAWASARRRKWR